jgi:hypothetical protein
MQPVCREAIATAERRADGKVTQGAMYDASEAVGALLAVDFTPTLSHRDRLLALAAYWVAPQTNRQNVSDCVRASVDYLCQAFPKATARFAHLLRDIVGSPFQRVTLPVSNMDGLAIAYSLAEAAYDHRDPVTGHLDSLTLVALADALEEAGYPVVPCPTCNGKGGHIENYPDAGPHWVDCAECDMTGHDSQSLLAHLRAPRPHVRGCWAVDLVLGRE